MEASHFGEVRKGASSTPFRSKCPPTDSRGNGQILSDIWGALASSPMPTALLITDSNWVTNDVRSALAVDNWIVDTVEDPREAAEVVTSTSPDAVIIDLQVGSMGGMAIIRSIRAEYQTSFPPKMILLLDRSADRFLAKRARADGAVLKPIDPDNLRTLLRTPIGAAVSAPLSDDSEEE